VRPAGWTPIHLNEFNPTSNECAGRVHSVHFVSGSSPTGFLLLCGSVDLYAPAIPCAPVYIGVHPTLSTLRCTVQSGDTPGYISLLLSLAHAKLSADQDTDTTTRDRASRSFTSRPSSNSHSKYYTTMKWKIN